jgi:L-ascorbate metabolism protein UlaG (beta-lactamase superfamily)
MSSRSVIRTLAAALAALPLAAAAQGAARSSQGSGKAEITWYGHAAFVIRTPGGTVLAVDPFFQNPRSPDKDAGAKLEKVDYILVSHGHNDHIGEAIALAERTGAKLISGFDLGRALVRGGYPEKQATFETQGNVGGAIEAGDATVIMVPAIHSSDVTTPDGHQGGGSPVGFVIKMKGGPTVYHTGDTDVTMDMRQIPERYGPVDVMLACIGGHFTMDPQGAALAASYVKAKTVVPMHFGTFPVLAGTPKELEAALKGRAKVRVLEPGKPATF